MATLAKGSIIALSYLIPVEDMDKEEVHISSRLSQMLESVGSKLEGPSKRKLLGIAYGHSTDQYTLRDDSQFTLNTRWSATLVKGDAGQWQLASLHVSTNLFDNPVLDMLKQYSLIISIATGFAGLMIGILGTKMLNSTPNNSPVPKE